MAKQSARTAPSGGRAAKRTTPRGESRKASTKSRKKPRAWDRPRLGSEILLSSLLEQSRDLRPLVNGKSGRAIASLKGLLEKHASESVPAPTNRDQAAALVAIISLVFAAARYKQEVVHQRFRQKVSGVRDSTSAEFCQGDRVLLLCASLQEPYRLHAIAMLTVRQSWIAGSEASSTGWKANRFGETGEGSCCCSC